MFPTPGNDGPLFFGVSQLEFKTNCADCGKCQHKTGLRQNNQTSFKVNLSAGQVQRITHLGREFAVVPVVMVKAGVVMNDSLVPTDELHPITWNGVPVTVGHPQVDGNFVSANFPEVVDSWAVGTIYNSRVEAGDLKAEAWLDIVRVQAVRPGLIEALEAGTEMDVSTGYFSDDVREPGEINGNAYTVVSRNLNPDHLALLPDVSGACSWQDGCGVRANERSIATMSEPSKTEDEKVSVNTVTRILNAVGIGLAPKANERGNDDDYRQIVADLISNDASPFLPDDEESLRYMSFETLKRMRDDYVGARDLLTDNATKKADDEKADDETEEEGGQELADKDKVKDNQGLPTTLAELGTLIANAVKEALPQAIKANSALTPEQVEALESAVKVNADHRTGLVTHITTHSDMTEDMVKAWPTSQLELIANGLRAPVNYGGRGVAPVVNASAEDVTVNSMIPAKLDFSAKQKVN